MRYYHYILILLVLMGCKNEKSKCPSSDKKHYNNLIVSTAVNAYINIEGLGYFGSFDIPDTHDIVKNVYDTSLAIVMHEHSWNHECTPCVKTEILYVSDANGFEFAFPFYEQNLYDIDGDSLDEKLFQEKCRIQLNTSVKYVVNKLASGDFEKVKKIARDFADLMGLRVLTVKDTLVLWKTLNNQYNLNSFYKMKGIPLPTYLKEYTNSLKLRMENIRKELIYGSPLYFYCYTTYIHSNIFWKFDIIKEHDQFTLNTLILKGEYNPVVRF